MKFLRNVMGAWALVLSGMALCGLALSETKTLEAVTVTANPLGAADWIAPVMSLTGTELLLRTQPTLGETLSGMPGISSTYFGPNASRPVIRGLDGDRVRVLQNSGASGDVSALSYDHAVSLEPMLVERIEVLRGPAALMYGGSAVGGVVNVLDNRIAREAMFEAGGGVLGKANAGWASGNREQSGAVMVETGTDRFALHVDAMSRNTQDVAVPKDQSCTRGGVTTVARSMCNSASQSWGGAVGGSVFFDQGYVGASLSTQGMSYGTVAEDQVRIGMQSSRLALEGELKDLRRSEALGGWLQSVRTQFSRNQYQHTEFAAEVPGTVFAATGNELRLEARHHKTAGWEGGVGLQLEFNEFSAVGSEAFAPFSQTRSQALFVHEEYPTQWGRWSAGARAEQVQVESLGHPTLARFQAASRSFTPQSYALGALWRVASDWQLTTNLTWNERAPKDYELFANGTHVATNTIEIGRSNLGKEKSSNLDVGAAWKRGAHLAQVQAFVHEFSNFISLELSDASTSPATYTYTPVQARLTGMEASGNLRLLGLSQEQESGVWTHTRGTLDLGARADTVRADNTSTGQALPRVAPMRVGAHLRWTQGPWSSRLGVDQVSAQDRVPTGQLATPGYQMWNAALNFREKLGRTQLQWFARLDNMSDVLAYSATSILTQTVPGKAPLPGRSLRLGLQISF